MFECETSDPDDFLTLCWLADHPDIDLVGVCVTPGSQAQVRVVRWALSQCGKPDLPIGALNLEHPKDCVSSWHSKVYGDELKQTVPTGTRYGPELMAQLAREHPGLTILTGAPPKNLGTAHARIPDFRLARWVCQGGFAGDPVVPAHLRLAKFSGRETCATFNLGGAPQLAQELIASDRIERRLFVAKNVCHGCVWTSELAADVRACIRINAANAAIAAHDADPERVAAAVVRPCRQGAYLMMYGADRYLAENPQGKAIHDLLAAAVAVDETVCEFVEVELYRQRGEWGSKPAAQTRSWISIRYDYGRLVHTLAR